jgi:hypothetical protein
MTGDTPCGAARIASEALETQLMTGVMSTPRLGCGAIRIIQSGEPDKKAALSGAAKWCA